MSKLRMNIVQINGTEYVLPQGATDKEVATLCSMLLSMRRIDSIYSSDYNTEFRYQEGETLTIRLGSREIYVLEDSARAAREARNAEIAAAKLMSEPEASD
jgi:predicted subunit of tRNA(5-methylaminomethyl-2-thiouridylate) methyltransferase